MTSQPGLFDRPIHIDGKTADQERDGPRLNKQARRVFEVMSDGCWWTPGELELATGYGWASISARIRDFRKLGFEVEREYLNAGLFQYRLLKEGSNGNR